MAVAVEGADVPAAACQNVAASASKCHFTGLDNTESNFLCSFSEICSAD